MNKNMNYMIVYDLDMCCNIILHCQSCRWLYVFTANIDFEVRDKHNKRSVVIIYAIIFAYRK